MNSNQPTLPIFAELRPGDRVQLDHEVIVGRRRWNTSITGTVVRTERRRHGLHFQRQRDDKVYSDLIVLRLDDGELTTVTIDEFSSLRRLETSPVTETSIEP